MKENYKDLIVKIAIIGLMMLTLASTLNAADSDDLPLTLEMVVKELPATKLKGMKQQVDKLVEAGQGSALPYLKALKSGELYYHKKNKNVVFARKTQGELQIFDPSNNSLLSAVSKSDYRKIKTNNSIRKSIGLIISKINLTTGDIDQRLLAAKNIIEKLDDNMFDMLVAAYQQETDQEVKETVNVAIALIETSSDDPLVRLTALKKMEGSLLPAVIVRLEEMTKKDETGKHIETDYKALRKAQSLLKNIDNKKAQYDFLKKLFFGLSLGSVMLLAAIGLAITFGVMGVINMAHGELIMLGAYTTFVIQQMMPNHIDYSLFVAIPAAFLVAGAVGVAIERGVIRFLHGRSLETLLATFGLSLVLQQLVRTIFGPLNRSVESPSWMSGVFEFNSLLSVTQNRVYILLFSLLVFGILLLILKKTALGLYVRAVSQNRAMAKAMGVRSDWVDAMTFGLGSGIAGVAGVALSQITNVGPNMGQTYIIDSFMVVVFGGVGNLFGTLVSGFSLGIATKFIEPAAGAVLAKIIILVFIILFIQKYPRGLFPQKGRAAES